MRANYTLNAGPIIQERRLYEVQKSRYKAFGAKCVCGGTLEVYDRDLGYCQTCGAEYFIQDACSRTKGKPSVKWTGRYTR